MPLPTPDPDEEKDEFVDRCMGDDTMNQDFGDPSQRRAVCEKQWDSGHSALGEDFVPAQALYPQVARAVFCEPWALKPDVFATICDLVRFRASGGRFTADEIQQRIGAAPARPGPARQSAVAVLPLYGVMGQRMNLMTQVSGGTSTELFGKAFQALMADPAITAVVLDVDSPGGSVFGVQELWQIIMDGRGRKPIVAVANSTMASAAYWVASAADEIVVTPSGQLGSIGVVAAHEDISVAEEKAGRKTTLVSAGKRKVQGHPFEALTDEARADLQEKVDSYFGMFVQSVAHGRAVPVSEVRGGFGEGGILLARDAVKEGLADRVGTLDDVLAKLTGRSGSKGQPRADDAQLRQRRAALLR